MDPVGALLILGRTVAIFGAGWLLRGWLLGASTGVGLGRWTGMLLLFAACLLQVLGLQSLFWEDGVVPWNGFVAVLTVLLAVAYTIVEHRRGVANTVS